MKFRRKHNQQKSDNETVETNAPNGEDVQDMPTNAYSPPSEQDTMQIAETAQADQSQEPIVTPEKRNESAKNNIKKKKRLPKWLRAWIKLLVKIGVISIAVFLVWTYVGEIMILHDTNMYPHIKDGDLVVVYKLETPIKNSAVMYWQGEVKRLGRIVAAPKDIVDMSEEGLFTINGLVPYENVFYDTHPYADGDIEYPYTVPDGYYFILNDMRETPSDSRMFGAVPAEDVIGTVALNLRHRGF